MAPLLPRQASPSSPPSSTSPNSSDSAATSTWNSALQLSRNTIIIVGLVACMGLVALGWKILDCMRAQEAWRLGSTSTSSSGGGGEVERGTQQLRREVEGSEALSREDIGGAMRGMEAEGRGDGDGDGDGDRGERATSPEVGIGGCHGSVHARGSQGVNLDLTMCKGCHGTLSEEPFFRATCTKCDADMFKPQATHHSDDPRPKRGSSTISTDLLILHSTPIKPSGEPGNEDSGGSGNGSGSEGAGTPETVIHVGRALTPPPNREQDTHNRLLPLDIRTGGTDLPPSQQHQQPSPSQIGVAISGSPFPRVRAESSGGGVVHVGGSATGRAEYDPYRPAALSKSKSKGADDGVASPAAEEDRNRSGVLQARRGSKSASDRKRSRSESESSGTGRSETQIPRPRARVLSGYSVFPDPEVVSGLRRGSRSATEGRRESKSESESSSAESLKTQISGGYGL